MKLSVLILFVFAVSVYGQEKEEFACSKIDQAKVAEYFETRALFTEIQMDCRKLYIAAEQLWAYNFAYSNCHYGNNGCPVSLVMPETSELIRSLRMFDEVKVETIFDESGKVIYAAPLNGHTLLRNSARRAACKSLFSPKSFCGSPVMDRRTIKYFFYLS